MADLSTNAAHITTSVVVVLSSLYAGFTLGRRSVTRDDLHNEESDEDSEFERLPSVDLDKEEIFEEEDEDDLGLVKVRSSDRCKLVLLVRTDLRMGAGKISAQHATLACYKALSKWNMKLLDHWEDTGQAKIALKITSEEQLLELQAIARSLNLCAKLSLDEQGPTVLGIGPAPIQLIDQVTGHLKLL